jgi:outer membrane protein assembly factor BamB
MKNIFLPLMCSITALASAGEWPCYRGTNFDGVSPEKGWSSTWPAEGPKELWRATLGPGGSSVTLSQGRLYTMGNVGDNDIVYCFDALTGKELWRHSYPTPLDKRSWEGGPASTPAVDGDRVYTVSHRNLVYCLDATTGKVVWSKDLMKEFKTKRPMWGFAGSALVDGEQVVLDVGGDGNSTVALNKKTGAVLWKAGDDQASYATPMPWTNQGKRVVLIFKARALVAQDITNGAELWRFPWKTSWDVHCAFPIPVGPDKLFFSSGYDAGGGVLDVKGREPVVIWQNKNMCNQMNSSVLVDGYLYGVSGNDGAKATLNCVEAATGKLLWSYKGLGCGSVLAADGKLIVLGEKGELVVAPATPKEFQPVAKAQVLNGRCWVVPVLVNGILYCRSNQGTLVALDLRAGTVSNAAPVKAEPYANDFEKEAVDKLPATMTSEAAFVVKEEGGNKFLELPAGSVAETVSAQFGSATAQAQVSVRAWSTKKGRLFPQFGVGLGGVAGWRVQVSPAKKAVELLLGDEVKATAPFEWTTEKWTQLSLQVANGKVEAKAALEGQAEPTALTAEASATPTGKAVLWAGPFAGTAIRFDDLKLMPR